MLVAAVTTEAFNATEATINTTEAGEQPPTPPMFGDPHRDKDPSKNAWNNVNHISECDPAFKELVERYQWLENPLDWLKRDFTTSFDKYHKNIEALHENSTFNATSIEPHVKCSELDVETSDIGQLFMTILELAVNITKSETLPEAYNYALQIQPLYKKRITYNNELLEKLDQNVLKTCNWLREYGEDTAKERQKVDRDYGNAKDQKDAAFRQFKSLTDLFNKLYKEVIHKINPAVDMATQYVSGNGTKMALSAKFETPFFTKAEEDLSDINKDLVGVIKDYTEEMTIGFDKMKKAYQGLFKPKLPVVNTYNVHQLALVQSASQVNDTLMQDLINSLESNMEENINTVITETYQRVMKPVQALDKTIADPVDDILSQIAALREALKIYKESTQMNTVFFM